jgi:hypothetical protein
MKTFPRTVMQLVALGLLASACSGGGDDGNHGTTATASTAGNASTPANVSTPGKKTYDCGVHASIGSCGPRMNNCYCSGTRRENPSTGNYFCVFPCSSDSDCVFDIKYSYKTEPWEGTCSGGSAGGRYCVSKPPTP